MNRGLAKRTVFETQEDVRWFLARLAWRVHAEELELHQPALSGYGKAEDDE